METTIGTVLRSKGNRIVSIEPEARAMDAVQKMNEERIGSLLVLDAGQLVGILTERDILVRVVAAGRVATRTRVRDVMTPEVRTLTVNHRVGEVMRIMTRERLRHLPVLDEEEILGMVSIGDLTKWVSSTLRREVDDLTHYIAGPYVA